MVALGVSTGICKRNTSVRDEEIYAAAGQSSQVGQDDEAARQHVDANVTSREPAHVVAEAIVSNEPETGSLTAQSMSFAVSSR
jgi:hypothetical protein